MKIHICTDDGEVIETLEGIDEGNLSTPIAIGVLMCDIREAVIRGVKYFEKK